MPYRGKRRDGACTTVESAESLSHERRIDCDQQRGPGVTYMELAYSSNAYMRYDIETALRRIAELGYQGVELMADEPHLWPATTTKEEIGRTRAVLTETGLRISNINAFMMNAIEDFWHPSWIEPDRSYRAKRVDHTIAALRMAAELGAPSITTEPGGPLPDGMSREEAIAIFADGLGEALRVAEEVDVWLLVEPEPDLLIENRDEFYRFAADMSSPRFGLNFDVGHFYCVADDVPDAVSALSPWTRHYHLEDIAASRVHEHLIPGHGAIDFGRVLRAIEGTGYDGFLTVELYPYLEDPDGAGREARSFLSDMMP